MLEERDIDQQISDLNGKISSGAVIVQDNRVNNVQNWIFGTIGVGLVAGTVWVGANISGLRETVVRLVTQNEFILSKLDDYGERIKDLERKP